MRSMSARSVRRLVLCAAVLASPFAGATPTARAESLPNPIVIPIPPFIILPPVEPPPPPTTPDPEPGEVF